MSRYHGNGERCPHCGIAYGRFRTGLTYREVFELLKDYSDDPRDWSDKSRGVVLGKWYQLKQELWEHHTQLGGCEQDPRNLAATG